MAREAKDVRCCVDLGSRALIRLFEVLPHDNRDEPENHRIQYGYDGKDETRYLVVLAERHFWKRAVNEYVTAASNQHADSAHQEQTE